MSDRLYPDQDRRSVGNEQGPNCLQIVNDITVFQLNKANSSDTEAPF